MTARLTRPDWWNKANRRDTACEKLMPAVMIGNQIIFELSNGDSKRSYGRDEYFLVKDKETGWWYLVWDLNGHSPEFHGQFSKQHLDKTAAPCLFADHHAAWGIGKVHKWCPECGTKLEGI